MFFTRINLENLLFSSTIIAVVAIGQAFVVMVAGIDLSVGAVLALSSVLSVGLAVNQGLPVWLSVLIALGCGAAVGLINGLAVTRLKIPALIAALAMMSIARGIVFIYSGGRNIAPIPEVFSNIQAARLFGIPVVIICTIVFAISLSSCSAEQLLDGPSMRLEATRSRHACPASAPTESSSQPTLSPEFAPLLGDL